MGYRKLGKSDIDVSAVAVGLWAIAGGSWGDQDENEAIATIRAALDQGVNLFDTADGYGRDSLSEVIFGKALVGRRKEAVIATKFSNSNADAAGIQEACENSLRRLRSDYIDLYQIHWPSRKVPLDEQWRGLDRLKEQGKVRAIGVCNFGVGDLTDLLKIGDIATDQLPYNLLWRAVEFEIVDKCVENGIAILPYSPLMQGMLTGKFKTADDVPPFRARTRHFSKDRPQSRHGKEGCEKETFETLGGVRDICDRLKAPMARVALAWLLEQPGVVSVLAGARNPAQLAENMGAAELNLPDDVLKELSDVTDDLKTLLGPDPDMWGAASEARYR